MEDALAIQAYNMLADGNGAINWAGLPLIAAYLGIQHIEPLMHRLTLIKLHRPPEEPGAGDARAATLAG